MTTILRHKNTTKRRARLCSIGCFCLAASILTFAPYFVGSSPEHTEVLVRVDISQSMDVEDMPDQTTRSAALKKYLHKLWDDLPQIKRWLGIFAWEAQSLLPLTTNRWLLHVFLDGIDHETLSTPWTRISDALQFGVQRFDVQSTGSKYMVIATDGGDDPIVISPELRNTLKTANIHVIIVGVGTVSWGPIIQWTDLAGNPQPKLRKGLPVHSSLAEERLRDLTAQLDGTYINLLTQPYALHDLLRGAGRTMQYVDSCIILLVVLGLSSFVYGIVAPSNKQRYPV